MTKQSTALTASVGRWLGRSRWARIALLWSVAFLLLCSFMLSEVLKENNYLEIFPSELVIPLVMHGVTALIIALLIGWLPWPKRLGAKLVSAAFISLLMVNYDSRLTAVTETFRPLFPLLPTPGNDLILMSVLFLAALVSLGVLVGQLVEKLQAHYTLLTTQSIVGCIVILTVFVFAGQAVPMLGVLKDIGEESSHLPGSELEQAAAMQPKAGAEKPDIYYIVFDRYTNNAVLKSQFAYDNTPFLDMLRQKGFAVDDKALSQYPFTAPSLASTMNMGYHNDDTGAFKDNDVQAPTLFHNMVYQSEAVKLLKAQGYTYYNVGSNYGSSNRAPLADNNFASEHTVTVFGLPKKRLRKLESSQFTQSPYYRFFNVGAPWWPLKSQELGEIDFRRNQLQTLHELASSDQPGGRFIFAHLLLPHEPFYFNADGSLSSAAGSDTSGRPIKQKYTNQLAFVNSQISLLLKEIDTRSGGKAIVLLVSDEGPYPTTMNQTFLQPHDAAYAFERIDSSDMTTWPADELAMKFGILQAVRIPKATEDDLAHLAPVNVFRIVLNHYFGYNFDYLPECHMALPEGRQHLYVYADVTGKVTDSRIAGCSQYE